MNKIVKAGLYVAGQVLIGQAIVFGTFVTVGLAGRTVDNINKKNIKKELQKERRQEIKETFEVLKARQRGEEA